MATATEAAFADAAARHSSETRIRRATLVGAVGQLVYVGETLDAQLGPTFAHLADDGAPEPDRAGPAIRFCDRVTSGVPRPVMPADADWQWHGEGWTTSGHFGSRYVREDRPGSVFVIDRAEACATAWYDDATCLTLLERGRPLQRIMTVLCRSLGVLDVHAALVSRGGNGVLIVGGRGRGKTTTSLDCLFNGLDFLGDDSVGFARAESGAFIGYSLYGSARVHPAQLDRWPAHRDAWLPAGPADEKALLRPALSFPQLLVRQARIVAIALPVVTGGPVRATPASPREVLDDLLLDSGNVRRFRLTAGEFRQIAALTKALPCYRIEVGPYPSEVAAGIDGLIQQSTHA